MSGGDFINLTVKGIYGYEYYFFRMKRSTQLIKLMNAYCDRQPVDLNITAFLFDGRRLHGKQTPDELEMEEGDEIIAYLRQRPGGNYGDEDKKPNTGAFINLKVKGIYGNEDYFFRMKRSTQLIKLMNAYCDRQPVEFNITAFLFDGRRLHGKQTPDELEMEEGDEIIAYLRQTGGNYGDLRM